MLLPACSDSGPQRFQISGEAKFDGKPIPFGDVVFTPDGSKGNSGPQGVALIKNGKYDTRDKDGKGIAGGPTVILVRGLSGQGGQLICNYEMMVDFPKKDGSHPIEVPKEGAAKKATKPVPEI